MISAETMAELEMRGIDYILGARERSDKEVREIVLADRKPMTPLAIPRARDKETMLEVKEVIVGDWGPDARPRRYVVCSNPQEARRDAAAREAILNNLDHALARGDKALVGNAGYRRFLRTPREGHFEIDPARVAEDARFDGVYVRRTNSKLNTLSVALAYRQLWRVEAIFRTAQAILETRPIHHHGDGAIAGHLFCSFLALVLTSIGSRRSVSIRTTSASSCGPRRRGAPALSARRSASRCRLSSANFRRPRRRPQRPTRHSTAGPHCGVVPRAREFLESPRLIRDFQIRGVQLQPEAPAARQAGHSMGWSAGHMAAAKPRCDRASHCRCRRWSGKNFDRSI
jgi:hypothetical protein